MKQLLARAVLRIIRPALALSDEQRKAQIANAFVKRRDLDIASLALFDSRVKGNECLKDPAFQQAIADAYDAYWLATDIEDEAWEVAQGESPESNALLVSPIGRVIIGQLAIDDIELPCGIAGERIRTCIQSATEAIRRARSFACANRPTPEVLAACGVGVHATHQETGGANATR